MNSSKTKRSRRQPNPRSRQNRQQQNKAPGTRVLGQLQQSVPRRLPIPMNTRVVLQYSDYYLLTSSVGVAYAEYSGNNVYDPDVTFTGHQPYYFDRYAALYQNYVVVGSKIKISTNVDTGSNQGVVVGLYSYYANPVPNTSAGLRQICESSFGSSRLFINNPVQAFDMFAAERSSTMLSTSQQELMLNSINWTSVSSGPTKEWKYQILATNVDASTTSFGLALKVEIEYDILFTIPIDEGPSAHVPSIGIRKNDEQSKSDEDEFLLVSKPVTATQIPAKPVPAKRAL